MTGEIRKEDLLKKRVEDVYNMIVSTDYQTPFFNVYFKSYDSTVYKTVISKDNLKIKIREIFEKYDVHHFMDEDETRKYLEFLYAKYY